MRNALLVYPDHPPSYWGINYALEMLGAKAAFPPLGLLTVAAMFPPEYDLRVVDMNVSPLEDSDLDWADMVFTSTMIVQRESLRTVIERCNGNSCVMPCSSIPTPPSYWGINYALEMLGAKAASRHSGCSRSRRCSLRSTTCGSST